MQGFTPSKKTAQDFNGGVEYVNQDLENHIQGDILQAETINNLVEAVLFAQEKAYDLVIRTQTDFDEWCSGMEKYFETAYGGDLEDYSTAPSYPIRSVLLVGDGVMEFTRSITRGIRLPCNLFRIDGINNAKIRVNTFHYDAETNKGGVWWGRVFGVDSANPEAEKFIYADGKHSIRGVTVTCDGDGSSEEIYAFHSCGRLEDCFGIIPNDNSDKAVAFKNCHFVSRCYGRANSLYEGRGFENCTMLSDCIGTGAGGHDGFGFVNCSFATNCKGDDDNPSTTAIWGGTNEHIDLYTCEGLEELLPPEHEYYDTIEEANLRDGVITFIAEEVQ